MILRAKSKLRERNIAKIYPKTPNCRNLLVLKVQGNFQKILQFLLNSRFAERFGCSKIQPFFGKCRKGSSKVHVVKGSSQAGFKKRLFADSDTGSCRSHRWIRQVVLSLLVCLRLPNGVWKLCNRFQKLQLQKSEHFTDLERRPFH